VDLRFFISMARLQEHINSLSMMQILENVAKEQTVKYDKFIMASAAWWGRAYDRTVEIERELRKSHKAAGGNWKIRLHHDMQRVRKENDSRFQTWMERERVPRPPPRLIGINAFKVACKDLKTVFRALVLAIDKLGFTFASSSEHFSFLPPPQTG
jgi:hypothetical protein